MTLAARRKQKVAVIGSGVSGLACAYLLGPHHKVTLYEADRRLGGHANTVTVEDPDVGPIGVDTGFIVHNDRNYPNLVRLFTELGVHTQPSEMSFGVHDRVTGFAYRATNPATLLARPANAFDPRLWNMLVDLVRFFRQGRRFLAAPDPTITIGEFLERGRYSDTFLRLHLLPMGAAVWSTSPDDFAQFPAATLLRFLDNHGLLSIGDRPNWRTVTGGTSRYVDKLATRLRITGRVVLGHPVVSVRRTPEASNQTEITTADGVEPYDAVILACHSDQARQLLADLTPTEDDVLGAIADRSNEAGLHTDTSVLPPYRRAWAAWNYHAGTDASTPTLTYDMTNLQRIPGNRRYLVTINPTDQPSGEIARVRYAHPQYTVDAIAAQQRFDDINGNGGIYFCGAYWGHGFHEDGMVSALRVARSFGVDW